MLALAGCGGDTAGDGPSTTGRVGEAMQAESAPISQGVRPPSAMGSDPLEVQAYLTAAQAHSDATVRLQALEVWAQHPGGSVDTLTQALVDEDEAVRARAQELLEHAFKGP